MSFLSKGMSFVRMRFQNCGTSFLSEGMGQVFFVRGDEFSELSGCVFELFIG